MQAGAGEPAKTVPERAGPRDPGETEPWTETTADLTNVLKRGAGMAAIGFVIVQIVTVGQTARAGPTARTARGRRLHRRIGDDAVYGGVRPGRPLPGAHPARARRRGCRQHGADRDLCDGPAARGGGAGGLAADRRAVPRFAGGSDCGGELGDNPAAFVVKPSPKR